MGMVVRTNTMALNAYRQLGMNNSAVAKSLEKLASGYRINRAGDDAAGLAISEKMKAQIKGLETASANAQDGISLIQTAEGNLSEVHDMLNRMVELATKSANGTYTSTERQALQDEADQLLDEIDRISQSANFNGTKLLNGTMGLNNEALAIGESKGFVEGGTKVGDDIIATDGTTKLLTVANDHASTGGTQVKPKFTLDFANYKYEVAEAGATAGDEESTLAISVGGKTLQKIDVAAGQSGAVDADHFKFSSAADTNGLTVGSTELVGKFTVNDLFKIGDEVYKVTAKTGDTVSFEWDGNYKAVDGGKDPDKPNVLGTWTPTGVASIAATKAKGGDEKVTDRVNCSVYNIDDAVAGGAPKRAGATLTLTSDMIAAGNSITIGKTTFTFAEGKAPETNTDNAGANKTINVDSSLSAAEQLKMVTEQLSHMSAKIDKDATTKDVVFKIGRHNDTGKIEIEEEVAAGADPKGFTANDLKSQIKVKTKDVYANIKLTVTQDKLADTEKLVIDGTEYSFSKGATFEATKAAIQNALSSDYTLSWGGTNGNELTLSAKDKDASSPIIAGTGLTLQIGDTADTYNRMNVKVDDMSTNGLKLDGLKGKGIMNEASASKAIDTIKKAINTVSSTRAGMGALQNRLEHTINNLDVAAENLSAANSRIRDTDMAKEMMNYTKMNVLVQSAQAMLAQANQQPQSVLQLLQ